MYDYTTAILSCFTVEFSTHFLSFVYMHLHNRLAENMMKSFTIIGIFRLRRSGSEENGTKLLYELSRLLFIGS